MATPAIARFKLALGIDAYGIELRLWKETAEREWGATFRVNGSTVTCHFEEDNLTLAKLHVLGEARNRVLSQSDSALLPACETLLDSWKPIKLPV